MMDPKWLWLSVLLLLLEGCRWSSTDAYLEHERIALLQLKPFFDPYNNNLRSWVEKAQGSDCCQWERVECNTSSRRVIGLSLNFTRFVLPVKDVNVSLFLPFKKLKRLDLSGNSISGFVENEGSTKLSFALENLKNLDLSDNDLNDTILSSLCQLSSLKHLYLAYNLFSGSNHEKGFQWLSRLHNLETLDLNGNSLKNNIMFHMGSLSSLKTLSLSENNLKGMVHLNELNNLTKLKNLDLSRNGIERLRPISNQGKETGQLRLTNLKVLDLSDNLLRNNIFAFLSGLSSLKSLNMNGNRLSASIDITELNNLTKLKNLDLSGNGIERLRPISKQGKETGQLRLTNLEVLDLSYNLLRNNTFAFISGLSSLKSMNVAENQLNGSIDITELNNLTKLKNLDLSGNGIERLRPISKQGKETGQLMLTNLEVLDLSDNLLRNNTFAFISGLSSLKSLNMAENQLNGSIDITDTGGQLNLINLEELDLSENKVNDNIFAFLKAFPSLKFLQISSNELNGSIYMKDLGALNNLEELDMSYNYMNEFVANKEYRSLRKLKRLYLNEVFTNGSKLLLLKLVEAFPSVKTFYLQGNYLNNTMITTHQVQDIYVRRSNVKEIILDYSYLDTNILQSIGVLTSLKTLSLRECGLIGSLPHQGILRLHT
ncbi:hypothetical protein PTKIN_Ptkin09bG0223700 [Pterospermum kingtungense]